MSRFTLLLFQIVFSVLIVLGNCQSGMAQSVAPWRAGFAKIDITPDEPVRMCGYGNRDHANVGIDTPLYVRTMALRYADDAPHLLLSVDTVGLSGAWLKPLVETIAKQQGVERQCIAVCCTHTHCAPHLESVLTNLFATPLSESELAASKRYESKLATAIITAAAQAMKELAPARLAFAQGSVDLAINRRVLREGRWVEFGGQADGPVDHSLPVLRITDEQGKLRGAVFNYACHCTTLGGEHYRINADWAGYATAHLEQDNADSIAICTIGCGADANPNPRGTVEFSQSHGRTLADEVTRIIAAPMRPIEQRLVASYGDAGLAFDLPTRPQLVERAADRVPQIRRHAEFWLESWNEHGRLPATYPIPIQTWRFGDELTMVLLGGEVVVDYALRLKRELNSPQLWVTSYANDVPGYICSERIRREGGYEYDRSAVYYNLPGPWATGTEDLLIRRVHEVLQDQGRPQPIEPNEALGSFLMAPGLEIQLVAAEPLVLDPINLAFGSDGKLWVVEMGDYPLGASDGRGLGRIKTLTDNDGDGTFDSATVFLDSIAFPTAVHPWGDGVIVCAAPDVFFARDTDGDGRADQRETWYTGFALANPQHRVNGFTYGLEHSLHCASGDNLGDIKATRIDKSVNASGRDVRIWPASGDIDLLSGRTQYIRTRNDWGECFGNDNSRPMYHFPIEDQYLRRNKSVTYRDQVQFLFDPPSAPPVFPSSNTPDRFNDLFALNRFTSACSAIVFRSSALGPEFNGAAMICEPVHNLVHSSKLVSQTATYRTQRHVDQDTNEFLASSDPWFRPVRAIEGSDGGLWIVDMYRQVIEHPEWIPESWQQQLDLRAGADRGRIYRIVPTGTSKQVALPTLAKLPTVELVNLFEDRSGAVVDLAQQTLLTLARPLPPAAVSRLQELVTFSDSPRARLHALWALHSLDALPDELLSRSLADPHFGVVRGAIQISEAKLPSKPELVTALLPLADVADPRVRLQLALSLGASADQRAGELLARLLPCADDDKWLRRAIVSSSSEHSAMILLAALTRLAADTDSYTTQLPLVSDLLKTAADHGVDTVELMSHVLSDAPPDAGWVLPLTTAWLDTKGAGQAKKSEVVKRVYELALSNLVSPDVDEHIRAASIEMLGRGFTDQPREVRLLRDLVSPREPLLVQLAAIERLAKLDLDTSAQSWIDNWSSLSQPLRVAVLGHLLAEARTTAMLLKAIEQQQVSPRDLSPTIRQQLRTTTDGDNRNQSIKLLGETFTSNREELISKYLAMDATVADAARGAVLFAKHCAACHLAAAGSTAAGPDLANLTDRSAKFLTTSILDPNRAVDPQFFNYVVLTADGRTLNGAIAEEAGDSLTLVHPDARRSTLLRREIESIRNTGLSLMPEGMHEELDPQAMTDLVRYLQGTILIQVN